MTVILTGRQFLCYHTQLRIIPTCNLFMLPRLVTHNTYMRSFQYKFLIVPYSFLSKKLHIFWNKVVSTVFFLKKHFFSYFMNVTMLNVYGRTQSSVFKILLPTLTPHTAIFVILDSVNSNSFFENNKVFVNHILFIFLLYVYKSRVKKFINMNSLIAEI